MYFELGYTYTFLRYGMYTHMFLNKKMQSEKNSPNISIKKPNNTVQAMYIESCFNITIYSTKIDISTCILLHIFSRFSEITYKNIYYIFT